MQQRNTLFCDLKTILLLFYTFMLRNIFASGLRGLNLQRKDKGFILYWRKGLSSYGYFYNHFLGLNHLKEKIVNYKYFQVNLYYLHSVFSGLLLLDGLVLNYLNTNLFLTIIYPLVCLPSILLLASLISNHLSKSVALAVSFLPTNS